MKINIQGCGPAGLSAAIVLAENGIDVKVFEKQNQVGGLLKHDVQAIRNYGKYDIDILKKFEESRIKIDNLNEIYRIEKYSPDLKHDVIFSNKKPLFFTVKRGISEYSLEKQLYEKALDSGAEIIVGNNLPTTQANIIASGSKFKPSGTLYGIIFESKDIELDTIKFFLLYEKGHNGYAYIAPYSDTEITFAITSFRNEDFSNLKVKLENLINHNQIINKLIKNKKIIHRYGGHGHFNIPETAIYNNKLLVGGAAGFVEAARGFGLKYAILSGYLAAKSIILDENYDQLWKKEFEQELINGFYRKLIFEKLSKKDLNDMIKGGEEIPINQYEKIGQSKNNFEIAKAIAKFNLIEWRKKFNPKNIYEVEVQN
ncbi:MAG: NAD(P)/FAD-dependent oxidoreductase [Candidatus Diapherotrites archaeon]